MRFVLFVRVKSFRKKKKFKIALMTSFTLLLRVKSYFCYPSKNLSIIFADSKQSKRPFGETPWLMGHHATPLVTLFFIITMLLTGHHAMPVVILWFTASATDLREHFLLSGVFYLTLLPASFKASLGPAV